MTEHLQECWAKHESDPPAWCICDELRACENRVAAAFHQLRKDDIKQWERFARDQFDAGYADGQQQVFALHPEWTVTGLCKPDCAACRRLTELITEWEYGYEKGLDAAREAVVALCWRKQYEGFVSTVDPQRVLAAIDALKEEQ